MKLANHRNAQSTCSQGGTPMSERQGVYIKSKILKGKNCCVGVAWIFFHPLRSINSETTHLMTLFFLLLTGIKKIFSNTFKSQGLMANISSPIFSVQDTGKVPTVDLLRLNNLRCTKTGFYTPPPKRGNENHVFLFVWQSPPWDRLMLHC